MRSPMISNPSELGDTIKHGK
ncbi:hypothetical protein F383_36049 [Gossypium arboreum]|uniref:Uncharacterized protein n=1 Tax=Gossypium arboreum TaxID=29729 RepID=A0A0B0NCR4_GOSAR|nr:hypothetical protein F383_36049 [Gossypium arboreum]